MALALAALAAGCGGGSEHEYEVQYKVSHSTFSAFFGQSALVTYAPGAGQTSQATVTMPWTSGKFKAREGDFLYISAQQGNLTGSVFASILVDGKEWKATSSSGAFAIATASGRCC